VSTTSTYLSSELGVAAGDTPRRWKTFVHRRQPYAVVDLPPSFHVETSL